MKKTVLSFLCLLLCLFVGTAALCDDNVTLPSLPPDPDDLITNPPITPTPTAKPVSKTDSPDQKTAEPTNASAGGSNPRKTAAPTAAPITPAPSDLPGSSASPAPTQPAPTDTLPQQTEAPAAASAPQNTDVPATAAPTDAPKPQQGLSPAVWIAIGVSAAALLTAGVLLLLRKRR